MAPLAEREAVPPGQIVGEFTVTIGNGFTVIVYVVGAPIHPAKVGVIVTVETIGLAVAFTAVKTGVLTVPLATNPIDGSEFVQANVAPAGVLANVFAGTEAPAQTTTFASAVTVGKGFTVIIEIAVFVQPAVVPDTV